ncbi:hypothetical protein Brsp07_04713 [Brucella sp. NBRC 14130]|uniref:hypothetical protein n=1 Tax=Brucella sp. NBRC 14130 TaxID=3075483 RepID=UPI003096EBD9
MRINEDAQASFSCDDIFFIAFSYLIKALKIGPAQALLDKFRIDCLVRLCEDNDEALKSQLDTCQRIITRARQAIYSGETSNVVDFDYVRALRAIGVRATQSVESGKKGKSGNELSAEPETANSGKKGKSSEWEKGEILSFPEQGKAKEIQYVNIDRENVSSLVSFPTPSIPHIPTPHNPSISPLNTNLNQPKNSSRRDPANCNRSLEIPPTRAKRARVNPLDHSQSAKSPKRSLETQKRVEALPNPFNRSWKHLNAECHFLTAFSFANRVQQDLGNVRSFRLTFSDARSRMLINDQKPTTRAARWIRQAFESRYGEDLPYAFKFEVSDEGQLHLHGFVIVPASDVNNATKRVIQRCLLQASGEPSKSTNSESATFYDGWSYYCYLTKAERATRRLLNSEKLTYMSDPLRQQVKAYHSQMRGNDTLPPHSIGFACILNYQQPFRLAA